MSQTSREIVERCLEFSFPERLPRQLWVLPWAQSHFPDALEAINRRFPGDFAGSDYLYPPSIVQKGDPYARGVYVDEWGCVFHNLQDGMIGEVHQPILEDFSEWKSIQPPYEQLPATRKQIQSMYDSIARSREKSDKFIMSGCCPRPWERYQFIRGSENALLDILMPERGFSALLKKIHDFYLKEMELWARSDVDAVSFMDDWGTQTQLLIDPSVWREVFKPLYREYCELANAYGRYVFMHSDGFIQDILPDLIEIGVHALNAQLFVMDLAWLEQTVRGRITFWGEMDRQHVLTSRNPQVGREAVRKLARHLYDPSGGIIAQLEFGPGAWPETVMAVFEEWETVHQEALSSKSCW